MQSIRLHLPRSHQDLGLLLRHIFNQIKMARYSTTCIFNVVSKVCFSACVVTQSAFLQVYSDTDGEILLENESAPGRSSEDKPRQPDDTSRWNPSIAQAMLATNSMTGTLNVVGPYLFQQVQIGFDRSF